MKLNYKANSKQQDTVCFLFSVVSANCTVTQLRDCKISISLNLSCPSPIFYSCPRLTVEPTKFSLTFAYTNLHKKAPPRDLFDSHSMDIVQCATSVGICRQKTQSLLSLCQHVYITPLQQGLSYTVNSSHESSEQVHLNTSQ